MVSVLALDLATETGWCHDSPPDDRGGVRPIAGVQRFNPIDDNLGAGTAALWRWLDDRHALIKPDFIAFEAPLVQSHGYGQSLKTNARAARYLMYLAATVETWCELRGVECGEANVATVKAYFCHGGASKDDMLAVCNRLRWNIGNHNAADAAALWAYTKSELDPKFQLNTGPLLAGKT